MNKDGNAAILGTTQTHGAVISNGTENFIQANM